MRSKTEKCDIQRLQAQENRSVSSKTSVRGERYEERRTPAFNAQTGCSLLANVSKGQLAAHCHYKHSGTPCILPTNRQSTVKHLVTTVAQIALDGLTAT
jgi:hypothetical protein